MTSAQTVHAYRGFTYPVLPLTLRGKTKTEVFAELIEALTEKGFVTNSVKALQDVLLRDGLSGTAVFNGIPVPHAKTEAVTELCMVIGLSETAVSLTEESKRSERDKRKGAETVTNRIQTQKEQRARGKTTARNTQSARQNPTANGANCEPLCARVFMLVLWPTMNQSSLDALASLVNTLLDSGTAEKLLHSQTAEDALACLYGAYTP